VRGQLLQLKHRIAFAKFAVGEVGVAIDESRKHRHVRKIKDLGALRYRYRCADGFDFVFANDDDLIGSNRALIGVDQLPGLDDGDLGKRGLAPEKQAERERFQSSPR